MNEQAKQQPKQPSKRQLPIARSEDVEFSAEAADAADRAAQERARAADERQV